MTDHDPIDELRHANPVAGDQLPSANLARIRARVQETVMTDIQTDADRTQPAPRIRIPLALAGVTALIALSALVFRPAADDQVANPPTDGGGGMAMCIQFDTATLAANELAFDGVVTAVEGDQVTFSVTTWYTGPGGATVTLTNNGLGDVMISGSGSEFEVGARWLVSANDGTIMGCGYSLPYDDDFAGDWLSAF